MNDAAPSAVFTASTGTRGLTGRFGTFWIDAATRTLLRNGQPVELRPKCFDVLCFLAANPGVIATKDALAKAIWTDVIVTDESLARCISDIRHALGDEGPSIIKTVPRRGYVFAASLVAHGLAEPDPDKMEERGQSAAPRSARSAVIRRRWLAASIAIVLAVAITIGWWRSSTPGVDDIKPSIAILPFVSSGADPGGDYFSDGLTEDITIRLSKFSELTVIATESSLAYKGVSRPGTNAIGLRLGARYLVEGTVRRDGSRIRVSARLIEASSGTQRWADIYDRELEGIFALQDELAQKIVRLLISTVSQAELTRALRKPASTLGAYDLFLRGRALLNAVDTSPEGQYGQRLADARLVLQQAVDADPNYAPALAALSDTYNRGWLVASDSPQLTGEFQNPEVIDRARAIAERAVASDPILPEAHAQLAWVLHWQYRRDVAMSEFRRALELNPNMAEGRFALLLIHSGNAAEGIAFLHRVFRLDPLHRPIFFSYLANAYYLEGDYRRALDTSRIAVERNPAVFQARAWHAASAAQQGLSAEAKDAVLATLRLRPEFSISRFVRMVRLSDPQQGEKLAEGLRKAGLPE